LLVHYGDNAHLMEGLPKNIAQYDISEGKVADNTEKYSFIMRVSNNIHNVACLDEVEFVQEWTEEEKIPVKTAPPPTKTPPKSEEKKDEKAGEGEGKPAEGEGKPAEGE